MDSSTVISWTSSVDPDQTPHDVASDLCLHCLPVALLRLPGNNGLGKCWLPKVSSPIR